MAINYWLAALYVPQFGPTKLKKLLEHFISIENIFTATEKELAQHPLTPEQISLIRNPNWKMIEADLNWCEQNHCTILTMNDENYPSLLREIHSAPAVLFVQGDFAQLKKPQIAIVGSRNPTPAGYEIAEFFAYHLAKAGLTITSGLASGIDAASHQGALAANSQTIAVTGNGLRYIYPEKNKALAEKIKQSGAIITEFTPQTRPTPKNFPQRNRIISGLSLGVLIIEAAIKSGSLITARFALEQGREIFAIPGSIHNPLARGCHQLIREGAKLVETTNDILAELKSLFNFVQQDREILKPVAEYAPIEQKQQDLLALIAYEPTPLDTILVRSRLTRAQVSSMLLALELNGYVQTVPGGYARTRG